MSKPRVLKRNELHAEVQRRTRGKVHKDKSKEIPRRAKYKEEYDRRKP